MNKLNILNKNVLFLAGALLLAGCAKVAETPIEGPAEVPVGKTYTIIADLDNPATRSLTHYDETSNKFKFTWEENERIGVVPGGYSSVLEFKAVDPANGRFSFQKRPDDQNEYNSFVMAVSPRAALGSVSTVDNTVSYTVNYIGAYFQGQSNAIMVAGAATPESDGTQRFQFKHVGALVKVSYANVPAGTSAMVFSTPDHDITGSFTFNSATGVEAVASDATTNTEARVSFMTPPTDVQESVDFYLPIPTGKYQTFNVKLVKLVDEEEVTIPGSEQTFSTASPFTVARADVVRCPVVTVTPPADIYYEKVTSNDNLTSGQYLIVEESSVVAFNGALTALDAASNYIDVEITDDRILSTAETDAASFMINIGTESSTIQSASGYYIGNTSNSNALNTNTTTQYGNTISINDNEDVDIVSSGGAYLRFNSNSGQKRFRYFKSSTYTGQQPIALYKRTSSGPVAEKELNGELSISGDIKKQFNVNEVFSFGDGVVKATYSNGGSKTLSVTDVTVSGFDSSVAIDSQQITLTYTENGHSATGTYTVSIIGSVTGAKYTKISSAPTPGKKYLIVAGDGTGYVMPHPVQSKTQSGVSVQIVDGEIASSTSTDACAFTISQKTVNSVSYYTITYVSGSTTYYVKGNGDDTKLTNTDEVPTNISSYALWTITKPSGSYGTFNINDAGITKRSIQWRPSTYNTFGHYAGGKAGSESYYNVELYEYTATSTE